MLFRSAKHATSRGVDYSRRTMGWVSLICVAFLRSAAASLSNASGFPLHTFFELGLNRGQTLTDLLAPTNTDRNLVKPLLKSLMHGRGFHAGDWCFHGFEANPVFTAQLQEIENRLSRAGLCLHLNTETLAGTEEGKVPFYLDKRVDTLHGPTGKYFAEGSTMDPEAGRRLRNYKIVNITSVDFAAYLKAHLLNKDRRTGALAAMRMDIEGGEYALLPHLLRSRGAPPPVICELDLLVIEFHSKRTSKQTVRQHLEYRDRLGRACPSLRVALDPSNYEEQPWKRAWPRPAEWSHLASIDPYAPDRKKNV